MTEVLSQGALNRALLARQHLLERSDAGLHRVVEDVVGLQAQNTWSPYVGLWSRVEGLTHAALGDALVDRTLARIAVMRGTIHLVTAPDALLLAGLTTPVFARDLATNVQHGPPLRGLDLDLAELTARARSLVEERPRVTTELGALLARRWPDAPPGSLAYGARITLPLVQVPPRGVWGRSGPTTWTTTRAWLDPALVAATPDLDDPDVLAAAQEDLLLRYLRAYGPATVADAQAWSGLRGLQAVADRLGDRLVRFAGPPSPGRTRPRVMLDVPGAPLPDAGTPAPVRFLPDLDDVLIGHADRTRIVDDDRRRSLVTPNAQQPPTVLVDGRVEGTWRVERERLAPRRELATLVVQPLGPWDRARRAEVAAEGEQLVRFRADDAAEHAVRVE